MEFVMRALACRCAVAAAVVGTGFGVMAGQEDTFLTARGVRVPTPSLGALDCAGMLQVLTAIDGSGYRGVASRPGDIADEALLTYEDRLSRRYYAECVSTPTDAGAAAAAFSFGFADDGRAEGASR
jgi:hypothetical protein